MGDETALLARARGLRQHLVPRAALEALAETPDLGAFSRALLRLGAVLEPVAEPGDLPALERAIRQTSARHLAILRRWQRHHASAIDIVTSDLDRKSVRRLIRGAMLGAPSSTRLEGLTPTPALPERALTELARQPSPTAVVGLLAAIGHPDAAALAPLVTRAQPELFAVDRVLLSGWARRASESTRREPEVRDLVALRIDTANAQAALLLAEGPRDAEPAGACVPGGRWLSAAEFGAAAVAPTPSAALARLRTALVGTPLQSLLPLVATDVDAMERAYLIQTIGQLTRQARVDPLGSPTLLGITLRIEAQSRDLRLLAWSAALGTPPGLRKPLLVTPWA